MLARFSGAWGPAQRLKCWSEDPASHGTVQLRLRKPSKAPQGQRTGGYGSVLRPGPMGLRRNKKLKTWLAGSQPVRVAGSRPQGPVGQVSRGLGPGPPGLGARPTRGLGPFPHNLKLRFFRKPPGGSLAKAWVSAETGTWRETKPGYPPYPPPPPTPPPPPPTPPHPPPPTTPPRFGAVREKGRGFSPSPPSATIQHAPQGRRTLA